MHASGVGCIMGFCKISLEIVSLTSESVPVSSERADRLLSLSPFGACAMITGAETPSAGEILSASVGIDGSPVFSNDLKFGRNVRSIPAQRSTRINRNSFFICVNPLMCL